MRSSLVTGVFTPTFSPVGGLSPAFNSWPDLLGRLTYSDNGLVLDLRGLARELSCAPKAPAWHRRR